MASSDTEVVIIGGGAAGIAAARRLTQAAIKYLVLEARARLGGRAWTVIDPGGGALDLGCGWLHSADRNPWTKVAEELGRAIDRSAPPWQKPPLQNGFPRADQQNFRQAQHAFFSRLDGAAKRGPDVPSDAFLEPGCRWNPLIDAVATYITGAELKFVSAHDFDNYADDEINWRLSDGLGACVAAYGDGLTVALDCPVRQIDHSGRRLKIETGNGVVTADQAIVALPSTLIADEVLFTPALPQKVEAARGLPLGLNDKLFLSLDRAEEFEPDSRLFGHTDRTATASYSIRPLGRPVIEVYLGGSYAAALEAEGEAAFFAAARDDLVRLFGADFARRVRPLQVHRWGADPFARGSYSYALPGKAGCRATLAAPVDDRLFFAGEACSINDFSTAHGAFRTGVAAAEQAIAARRCQRA
jgi:monoamine oxidase